MKVGQIKKLNLSEAHTEVMIFNNNEAGDIVTEELYLELQDDCEVSAIGYALKSDQPVPLKFIDMAQLKVPDVVDSVGLYLLIVSAFEKVEITFSGACRATIKTVYGG